MAEDGDLGLVDRLAIAHELRRSDAKVAARILGARRFWPWLGLGLVLFIVGGLSVLSTFAPDANDSAEALFEEVQIASPYEVESVERWRGGNLYVLAIELGFALSDVTPPQDFESLPPIGDGGRRAMPAVEWEGPDPNSPDEQCWIEAWHDAGHNRLTLDIVC